MITSKDILDKLTTRNFMAMSFTSTFLYAVIVTVNGEAGISIANIHEAVSDLSATEALAIGTIGGGIGGVFFKMVSDMVQFYFRSNPKKNGVTPTP